MKLHAAPASMALAFLIGVVHTYLLIWAWAYIAAYSPLPHWLASHHVTPSSFQAILFPVDFLTNMALCVPAAYLLCKLRPDKLWLYLAAAALPNFIWQYRLVLGDFTVLKDWQLFLPGILLMLLPLPVTALIIRRLIGGAPNNSFKPTLLRGVKCVHTLR